MSATKCNYLTDVFRDIFSQSSQFMAVYDCTRASFIEVNESMKERIGSASAENLVVLSSHGDEVFSTLSGIPCRMRKLREVKEDIFVVEIFLAHTKTWNQNSDLVRLTDLTSDGVWEWFPLINFEFMSQRFWDILGYDQSDMEETPVSWMSFINPTDKELVVKMFEEHVATKGKVPYHATVKYVHKEGREVFILCRGSVVDWMPDGKPWKVIGTHTDVTDIVKKDAVEAQCAFIARMSHEIRSPLCTILNECELLETKSKSVSTKVIMQTCQQVISLTDDILALGKSQQKEALDEDAHDLGSIFGDCNKRHRLSAKKKGIRLKLSVGDLPDTVQLDIVKFNQVMDNLLNNAIKYSDSGTVTIDADYNFDDHVCEVRIVDEGMGIPAELQTNAFEEFVQGDATMQGAGIGLTLAKRLSKLMGGDVVIENSSESGTSMLFTSKLKELPDDEMQGVHSLRILMVDDMVTNRQILSRRLEAIKDMGVEYTDIVEAENGMDAFNKFKECRGDFQLVLMDCLMPVVDGFSATLKIHSECDRLGIEPVPVVAVTASVSPDVREKCLKHGMKYVVTKPYTESDLLFSIQACMKK